MIKKSSVTERVLALGLGALTLILALALLTKDPVGADTVAAKSEDSKKSAASEKSAKSVDSKSEVSVESKDSVSEVSAESAKSVDSKSEDSVDSVESLSEVSVRSVASTKPSVKAQQPIKKAEKVIPPVQATVGELEATIVESNVPERSKEQEIISNQDGTTTEVRRDVKKDGRINVRYITRDVDGNKLEDKRGEYNRGEGEEKVRIKTYDVYGEKLTDVQLKTIDGQTVNLRSSDTEAGTKVKYDAQHDRLVIRTDGTTFEGDEDTESDSSKLTLKASGDIFTLTRSGIGARSDYPMTVDATTGRIEVVTRSGELTLKALPDTIVETAKSQDQIDIVSDMEINEDSGLKYELTGTKYEKLFGAFTVEIPLILSYSAESGSFMNVQQGLWSKTIDVFSF